MGNQGRSRAWSWNLGLGSEPGKEIEGKKDRCFREFGMFGMCQFRIFLTERDQAFIEGQGLFFCQFATLVIQGSSDSCVQIDVRA